MLLPVKSVIGEISSSSSWIPSSRNQWKESSWIWTRCGISNTAGILPNERRAGYGMVLCGEVCTSIAMHFPPTR